MFRTIWSLIRDIYYWLFLPDLCTTTRCICAFPDAAAPPPEMQLPSHCPKCNDVLQVTVVDRCYAGEELMLDCRSCNRNVAWRAYGFTTWADWCKPAPWKCASVEVRGE